jgi:enterochelin esterase-like enzyme
MSKHARFVRGAALGVALLVWVSPQAAAARSSNPQDAPKRDAPMPQIPPEVIERMRLFANLVSPEVGADRKVTFRILAPKASEVVVDGEWAQGFPPAGTPLTKDEKGVWSATVGPLPAGSYRYTFSVDGAQVVDPKNTAVSESVNTVRSVVDVPAAEVEFYAVKPVPHGAVSTVRYHSKSLNQLRRMHVYTPPGYEGDNNRYPVLYLLHGAGDGDDSWTSIGKANFILDNLIAQGKAKPMIVVMPAGHTSSKFEWGPAALNTNAFESDFQQDVVPYVESHFRVLTERQNRAIAGLSMGGMQTLNLSVPNLKRYGYVGVFSSGLLMPGSREAYEKQHAAALGDAEVKKGLKLFWFATGKDDFLVEQSRATVEFFKRHNFQAEYQETGGAHTWENWREYLRVFAPRLFQ